MDERRGSGPLGSLPCRLGGRLAGPGAAAACPQPFDFPNPKCQATTNSHTRLPVCFKPEILGIKSKMSFEILEF